MPFLKFFKDQAKRYALLSHQQWGWLSGMTIGLGLGTYVLCKFGLQDIDWEIEGKIDSNDPIFKLLVTCCVIPLSSGLFANLFSNMGAGIDVITDRKTLLSVLYCCCCACEKGNDEESTPLLDSSSDIENHNQDRPIHGRG